MKLYEIIINGTKDDADADKYKLLAEALSSCPVCSGISEDDYRNRFLTTVGYDPTTVYDYDRIDSIVTSRRGDIPEGVDIDAFSDNVKSSFLDGKTSYINEIIDREIDEINDDDDLTIDDEDDEFDFDDDNEIDDIVDED